MIPHAAGTSAALLAISVGARIVSRASTSADAQASQMMRLVFRWKHEARRAQDPAMRLQLYSMALAALVTARDALHDRDLERASNADVGRIARTLETRVCAARQSLTAGSAAPPTTVQNQNGDHDRAPTDGDASAGGGGGGRRQGS